MRRALMWPVSNADTLCVGNAHDTHDAHHTLRRSFGLRLPLSGVLRRMNYKHIHMHAVHATATCVFTRYCLAARKYIGLYTPRARIP